MIIDPPIEKLIAMTPCRYALVTGIAERAKELLESGKNELEDSGLKAVSYAAKEIYSGKLKIEIKE